MAKRAVEPQETLTELGDVLQCPVCYELPAAQIFQCNEGHHVCGRCKVRLDVCPVCRAYFFGTRNFAMEGLIANMKKRSSRLAGTIITGEFDSEENDELRESTAENNDPPHTEEDAHRDSDSSSTPGIAGPPKPCSGLFRCLCCKVKPQRLPAARLLNHLRYFHSSELIEGRSENNEYLQAWQFSTNPDRIVTAIRIADMGLFFLIIEISDDSVYSWLVMAASPMVAEEFCYTFTLSGSDREALFSDYVWSVRACVGTLKKRQRCLLVTGVHARALLSSVTMNAKLSLRRTPPDAVPSPAQPRAVLRVANRSVREYAEPTVDRSEDPRGLRSFANRAALDFPPATAERAADRRGLFDGYNDPRMRRYADPRVGDYAEPRVGDNADPSVADNDSISYNLIHDLENNVALLQRTFATFHRGAEMRRRHEPNYTRILLDATVSDATVPDATVPDATVPEATVPDATVHEFPAAPQAVPEVAPPPSEPIQLEAVPLSRNARRRMRQRLRQAFRENPTAENVEAPPAPAPAPAETPPTPPASTNRTENAQRRTNGQSNPVLDNNNRGNNERTNAAARSTNSSTNAGNQDSVANNNAIITRTLNSHDQLMMDIDRFQAIVDEYQIRIDSGLEPPQPRPSIVNGNSGARRNNNRRRQRR